jgi:hypothetical protein
MIALLARARAAGSVPFVAAMTALTSGSVSRLLRSRARVRVPAKGRLDEAALLLDESDLA